MAFIPDQAVDNMTQLSSGAWRLYCYLARCRNQKTGLCCPSISTTKEAIGVNRSSVYALRKELIEKNWATFEGNRATGLFGFGSQEIQTTFADTAIDGSHGPDSQTSSPENQTTITESQEDSENSPETQSEADSPEIQTGSPEIQTTSPEIQTNSPKNQTAIYEQPANKNQQNITSKGNQQRSSPSERRAGKKTGSTTSVKEPIHPAISFLRELTSRYPSKSLWADITNFLGDSFDGPRLSQCYKTWVARGYNPLNYEGWLFKWYVHGIPEQGVTNNGNKYRKTQTDIAAELTQRWASAGGTIDHQEPDAG